MAAAADTAGAGAVAGRGAVRWVGGRWPGRMLEPRTRFAIVLEDPLVGQVGGEDSTRPSTRPRDAATGPPARLRRPLRRTHVIDLAAFVDANIGLITAALAIAVIVAVVGVLVLVRRVGRLEARLQGLTRGAEGRSLEAVLDAHLEKVHEVARGLDDVAARTAVLEAAQRKAFSRVGLVRYNPFEETGGNQSFALALLDANGDGWVLSSLHARTGTRIYAKSVVAGRSDAAVSEEEGAAIRQATA